MSNPLNKNPFLMPNWPLGSKFLFQKKIYMGSWKHFFMSLVSMSRKMIGAFIRLYKKKKKKMTEKRFGQKIFRGEIKDSAFSFTSQGLQGNKNISQSYPKLNKN